MDSWLATVGEIVVLADADNNGNLSLIPFDFGSGLYRYSTVGYIVARYLGVK